ncbi:adhesion G protein-coupled receptor E1-like [Branchiostoma floridae x Branchiostoma japonicum]
MTKKDSQGWLTLGLVIVSVVAVFIFVGYTVKSGQWKKVPSKLKVQMLACMAVAESLFVARLLPPPGVGCVVYAVILHYFLLTAFSSMNVLSLDLFFTFRKVSKRAKLRTYMLHTWLTPLLVVAVTAFVEFCPCSSVRVGYGDHCWIGNPTGRLVAFGVPVFCAILINAVFITRALLAIRKSFTIADAALSRSWNEKAWVYVRISFLMGFTWILGFIVPYVDSVVLEYIFIVLNASQGLLLSLLMAMTWDVMEKWGSTIRACFGQVEPNQNNVQTTTAASRHSAPHTTEVTATGSTDIPMTTFVDVEENKSKDKHLVSIYKGKEHTNIE